MTDCSADPAAWTQNVVDGLLASCNADGGWPYRAGDASSTEPTAIAVLALASADAAAVPAAASDWLAARQRGDGMFTASTTHVDASWSTPLAALALYQQGRTAVAQDAARALLAEPVFTPGPSQIAGIKYDASIPGWAWTIGDLSFVEPTALAMVFLKRAGYSARRRVRQGKDMLHVRALAAGAWNYGEPEVLDTPLFPTVAPTALALLALADEQDATTATAANWLLAQQGQISSLYSLGWATIGLNILGLLNDNWRTDVRTRWCSLPPERRTPMETALCLLGLAPRNNHPFAVA